MTLKHKIGQKLEIGLSGLHVDDTFIQMVQAYGIGNVILFRHNIENKKQLTSLCREIQDVVKAETGIPAFICIDQEGGVVTRLSDDCTNFPGAMAIAATQDPHNAYLSGLITGRELRAMGVNFNLAPDLDINYKPENPVIGVRSYGDTPDQVTAYGLEMIRGQLDAGIMCCAKHFPGHGGTSVDSHVGLPQITSTLEEMEKMELIPFKSAIDAGIPGIMSSHILFPQIEKEHYPATMSYTVMTDLLRHKLGFKGLTVSDCMEMGAIQTYYGTPKGILHACLAGIDIVGCSHTYSLARETCELLAEHYAQAAPEELASLDESVERILNAKQKYADTVTDTDLVHCQEHIDVETTVLKNSITLVHDTGFIAGHKTLFISPAPFQATGASNAVLRQPVFSDLLADAFSGTTYTVTADPTDEEIGHVLQKATETDSIVVGSFQAHIHKAQLTLIQKLHETGKPLCVVALRDPYDLLEIPRDIHEICTYEYSERACRLAADVLKKNYQPTGVLPLSSFFK